MRKMMFTVLIVLLLLGGLVACGVLPRAEAAAPLAEQRGLVRTTLYALPEELDSVLLLARTSALVLSAADHGTAATYEYSPSSGAFRRLAIPLESTWELGPMAASPDGCLWTAFHEDADNMLLKTSQGNVLIRCDLGEFAPESIVCDNVGHVFAATAQELRRYSPEGELQQTAVLPEEIISSPRLAAQRERIFLRAESTGHQDRYWVLTPDMTLGDSFAACVSQRDVRPIGSFLEGYAVMEADGVGLYAYREEGGWETVCLWSEYHLDGNVDSRLLSDAQGHGAVQYEKDGQTYCINLAPA